MAPAPPHLDEELASYRGALNKIYVLRDRHRHGCPREGAKREETGEEAQMSTSAGGAIRFEAAVPQFTVPDVVRTAEYYQDALGFEIAGYWDGERASFKSDPAPVFGIVARGNVQIFFNRATGPRRVSTGRAKGAYDLFVRVKGIGAFAAELRSRGAEILDGPTNRVYGQRELVIRDWNGLILTFGEEIGSGGRRGSQMI